MPGVPNSFPLQVVRHNTSFSYSSFTPGANLRLNGGGCKEGGTRVNFGPVFVQDPDTGPDTLDVFSSGTALNVIIPEGLLQGR